VLAAHAAQKLNETAVGDALTYACGQGNGTCDAIQPGGDCFQPDTGAAHASYAFNSYWQQFRKIGATCYFNNLAEQTIKDPSKPAQTHLCSCILNYHMKIAIIFFDAVDLVNQTLCF
jgi:hypothetical protein